ncbi:YoaK family protein [Streptomyces sp. NPDC006879]|uniref:YoaK family protein n=1 Tax=Streptomyces sp. NPDC006879 TaxID=3364767 RepID=UPI0036C0F0EE
MDSRLVSRLRQLAVRLFPGQDPKGQHGVLPPLLIALTFVTGAVDAVSFLGLDHVFVANMTGNVVLLGFALAGDRELSATASALAAASFVCGAVIGGRFVAHRFNEPMRLFTTLVAAHAVLVGGAIGAVLAQLPRSAVIVLLAVGMGLQNAVVRRLAVPDLTTTVLTMTLTGLAADRPGPASVRRLAAVVAMFAGALVGGLLQLHHGSTAALVLALALLAAVAGASAASHPPGPAPHTAHG